MKLSLLFGLAVALISTTALAYDLTYLGPIKAKETKVVRVDLPIGKLSVEVTSSNAETRFNCQFSSSYGGVVFEQNNVAKCVSNVVTQGDTSMNVSVSNLGRDSDYKIWVHDTP